MESTGFQVVDDNQDLVAALTRALGKDMPDAILVNVNTKPVDEALRMQRRGLDEAIKLVGLGRPLILYSLEGRPSFNLDQKFHWLYGHRNCGFVTMPARLDVIREEYGSIKYALNPDPDDAHLYEDDELCLSLLDVTLDVQTVKSRLRHDLHYAKSDPERLVPWLEEARKAGYAGSDQEVIAAVEEDLLPADYRPFGDRYFRGSFVDLEGTLFAGEELNSQVMEWIKGVSKGRITLWTGGDLKQMAKLCRRHKLPWKVLPKQLFRGATVQQAIDDLSQEELAASYGIAVENFRQASAR